MLSMGSSLFPFLTLAAVGCCQKDTIYSNPALIIMRDLRFAVESGRLHSVLHPLDGGAQWSLKAGLSPKCCGGNSEVESCLCF